ncbi:MAG: stage 0 sporulation family protein, partial [Lachnospiraceae bacterium]|nr:stage 0 sporulation family protein [Lachnospiraceae bacterium]
MARIIGVRFRHASKMYYFDPNGLDIKYNDAVIVETARGIEYGKVLVAPMSLEDDKIKQPLKPVIRLATEEDTRKAQEYEIKEKEALFICREKIRERELDMKLIAAEYAFDDSKLLFYFTADGRIDFRELVKDLAGIFRRRIELRQIGVRDETKILGGMGVCGRPLCCHTYLSDFAPVSIKMAKEQNLSLNPTKISGCCGRLMCCLNNEAETYCELKKGLPVKGDQATTPEGRHGEVLSVNILRQTVKIVVDMDDDEKDLQEFHVSEISFIPHSKKNKQQQQPKKKTEADKAEGKTAE